MEAHSRHSRQYLVRRQGKIKRHPSRDFSIGAVKVNHPLIPANRLLTHRITCLSPLGCPGGVSGSHGMRTVICPLSHSLTRFASIHFTFTEKEGRAIFAALHFHASSADRRNLGLRREHPFSFSSSICVALVRQTTSAARAAAGAAATAPARCPPLPEGSRPRDTGECGDILT